MTFCWNSDHVCLKFNQKLPFLYTPRSIKLPVKHTLTYLPPSYSFIVILLYHLLFSLHLFYGYALCNLAVQAAETKKCDLKLPQLSQTDVTLNTRFNVSYNSASVKFMTFCCQISSGHCISEIIKIRLFSQNKTERCENV